MNSSWICQSCRRRLPRPPTSIRHRHGDRASFISLNTPAPATEREDNPHKHPQRSRVRPRVLPYQYDRTVEDDFYERITEYRDPSSAPYSNPYLRPSATTASAPSSSNVPPKQQDTKIHTSLPSAVADPGKRHLSSQVLLWPGWRSNASHSQDDSEIHNNGQTETQRSLVQDASPADLGHAAPVSLRKGPKVNRSRQAQSESPVEALDIWEAFLASGKSRRSSIALRPSVAGQLARGWCESDGESHPSPSIVISEACQAKTAPHAIPLWYQLTWNLLAAAYKSEIGQLKASRSSEQFAFEILALWKYLFETHGDCTVQGADGTLQQANLEQGWHVFTSSEQMRQIRESTTNKSHENLLLFLSFPSPDLFTGLSQQAGLLAHMSRNILRRLLADDRLSTDTDKRAVIDFVEFVENLLEHSKVSRSQLVHYDKSLAHNGFSTLERSEILRPLQLFAPSGARVAPKPGRDDAPTSQEHVELDGPTEQSNKVSSAEQRLDDFKKRLARALERRNASRAEELFQEIKRTYAHVNKTSSSSGIPAELYTHLMATFMGLNRPQLAIDVWNTMTASGVSPGIGHWDAMLKGCGVARDGRAVQELWAKMIASGAKPDAQVWSTRIHGLAVCGHLEAAMKAFEEMAQRWQGATVAPQPRTGTRKVKSKAILPAAEEAIPAPKPNTQCLNNVVIGLARARRYDKLATVFSWAKQLGLSLDVYTFNPLFQAALLDGDSGLAAQLLDRMRTLDIKPDTATFTMMLGSLFTNSASGDSAPADEDKGQQATCVAEESLFPNVDNGQVAVKTLFSLMEQAGVKPTAHTFSTLVVGQLQGQRPNVEAAYGILRYLTQQGLPLSPQIYTALISFHFEQEPPDLMSVYALWHHARTPRQGFRVALDTYFYDRLARKWTEVGEIGRALEVYRSAKADGKMLGFSVLKMFIIGLLHNGNREAAVEIVQDVEQSKDARHARPYDEFRAFCLSASLL